jgi:cytochrome c
MTREEAAGYTDLMPDGKARMFTFVMEAKSMITRPSGEQTLSGPGFYEISGLAWSGRGRIERVEVSTDGGQVWASRRVTGAVPCKGCASCHGEHGEGHRGNPPIAGGLGTLKSDAPLITIGSYWPYATTVWDYINRAMPYQEPGSLTPGEVYSATAYVLYLNGIVSESEILNAKSLPKVKMPNRNGFVPGPRPDRRTSTR